MGSGVGAAPHGAGPSPLGQGVSAVAGGQGVTYAAGAGVLACWEGRDTGWQ